MFFGNPIARFISTEVPSAIYRRQTIHRQKRYQQNFLQPIGHTFTIVLQWSLDLRESRYNDTLGYNEHFG